jgi:hypothetical protein
MNSPTILDFDCSPLDPTEFVEPPDKCGGPITAGGRSAAPRNPIDGNFGCCAGSTAGHAGSADRGDQFAPCNEKWHVPSALARK